MVVFSFLQVCKQETLLPGGKVENLMTDFVAIDLLKPKTEKTVIMCTSCKANEEAIARCGKCPNFLCSHCTAAHQFMRCFDDHKVSCSLYIIHCIVDCSFINTYCSENAISVI